MAEHTLHKQPNRFRISIGSIEIESDGDPAHFRAQLDQILSSILAPLRDATEQGRCRGDGQRICQHCSGLGGHQWGGRRHPCIHCDGLGTVACFCSNCQTAGSPESPLVSPGTEA